jgi:hypothetical protein
MRLKLEHLVIGLLRLLLRELELLLLLMLLWSLLIIIILVEALMLVLLIVELLRVCYRSWSLVVSVLIIGMNWIDRKFLRDFGVKRHALVVKIVCHHIIIVRLIYWWTYRSCILKYPGLKFSEYYNFLHLFFRRWLLNLFKCYSSFALNPLALYDMFIFQFHDSISHIHSVVCHKSEPPRFVSPLIL